MKYIGPIFALLALASCSSLSGPGELPDHVECLSLSGAELSAPEVALDRQVELLADLEKARAELAAKPGDELAAIWVGRRLGYLGRYREAIELFTEALGEHPESYHLLRHRGHRYITTRRLELAVEDLRAASRLAEGVPDQYEPDGAPNEHGIPRSTTQSNIHYHLGLALYLQGDYEAALEAWERCLYFSRVNDDMFVAAAYWTVLTSWRLGRDERARELLAEVRPSMDVLENHDYHRLLLLFRGDLEEADFAGDGEESLLSSATLGYGLGAWHLHEGRADRAREVFRQVTSGSFWPAFGHIAAEAELARD